MSLFTTIISEVVRSVLQDGSLSALSLKTKQPESNVADAWLKDRGVGIRKEKR